MLTLLQNVVKPSSCEAKRHSRIECKAFLKKAAGLAVGYQFSFLMWEMIIAWLILVDFVFWHSTVGINCSRLSRKTHNLFYVDLCWLSIIIVYPFPSISHSLEILDLFHLSLQVSRQLDSRRSLEAPGPVPAVLGVDTGCDKIQRPPHPRPA